MTPTETISYLQNSGYYGARVQGSAAVVYLHPNGVVVEEGPNERIIELKQFDAEFQNATLRRCEPVN